MKATKKTLVFKKPISLAIVLVPLFLFNSLVSKQCKCKQGKIVITEAIKAPIAISFIDANRMLSKQIPKVKVTLIDSLGQVVTSNNLSFTSIEIQGGVMSLGLKKNAVLSREIPYRFAIKAEAEGYSTNFRSIVVTNDTDHYVPVFMVKVDDPPAGMAGFTGSFPVSGSSTQSPITIKPKISNQLKRNVSVMIPDSTVFMYNRKPIGGSISSISYNFSYASPRNISALRTFPGGGGTLITDAFDRERKKIATPQSPFFFASSGWMTLEMKAGRQVVNGFSQPIDLIMPIEDSLINPETKTRFRLGDTIRTWSLDEKAMWNEESIAIVENSSEGLIAKMKITHLSTWNFDSKINPCTLTISYRNLGSQFWAYTEVFGTSNGFPFIATNTNDCRMDYVAGADPSTQTFLRAPGGTEALFVVYDNETAPSSPRATSDRFQICTAPPIVDIPPLTNTRVNLSFQLDVSSYICDNAVWYRSCGAGVSCNSTDCMTNAASFLFGGILRSPGLTDPAITTLYTNTETFTGNYCIRLWYGINRTTTMPLVIDFSIDFNSPDNLHQSDQAQTSTLGTPVGTVNFEYWFEPNAIRTLRIRLTSGMGGLAPFTSCP